MKQLIPILVMLATPALADAIKPTAPLPGRDKVTAGKPDWCGDYEPSGSMRLSFVQMEIESHGYTEKALRQIAQIACETPLDPETQQAVAAWRQEWINLTGLAGKHEHQQLSLRLVQDSWEAAEQKFCTSMKPGAEASPEQVHYAHAIRDAAGCGGDTALSIAADGTASDLGWWLDRRAAVSSELVRAMFVLRCVRILKTSDWPDASDPWVLGSFASCGPDGRRLDEAAFEKEIAAAPWNDVARANARATFALAKATVAHLTADIAAMIAKEPAYARPALEAPEAGWKAWEANYAANQAAFEAALTYEDRFYGPSKRALQGCGSELRKNFAAYVAGRKPRDLKAARAAATDEVGAVLLTSLAMCDSVEGRFLLARVEHDELKPNEVALRRGPRLAAYSAALAALGDLVADRGKFPWQPSELKSVIEMPRDGSMYEGIYNLYANKTQFDNPVHGTVGAASAAGEIAFKKVKVTIPNRICRPNGRILSIHNGDVVYDSDCVTKGTVTLDETPQPVSVPPEVAAKLAPGVRATFEIDQRDMKRRVGFPTEVWRNDRLVAYLGVPLD